VPGRWTKLHSEKLRGLYTSPNVIKMIKSKRDGQGMPHSQEKIGTHNRFCREKTQERPRQRQEDNIKMDLTETGWQGMDWIQMVQIGVGGECLQTA
jgi:hypothetical protein